MLFKIKLESLRAVFSSKYLNLKFVARNLLVVILVSFFVFAPVPSAYAARTVILEYESTRTSISYKQLENFAKTGTTSDELKKFFQKIPLTPKEVSTLLYESIPDTGVKLNEKETEFLLIQLNKLVGSQFGREDTKSLAKALSEAYLDRDMSIIELARRYPKSTVKLNLKNLDTVERDVKLFVERWDKFLRLFGPLREELLCNCDNITPLNRSPRQLEILPDNCSDENPHEKVNTPQIAQQVVFGVGLFQVSFSISDLKSFAKTGEIPRGWNTYFKLLKLTPEDFRNILTTESKVCMKFLDDILNNLLGEYILFQIGQIIHPPSAKANIQALRSALVLSAADDNKISILEMLQNYPAQRIIVQGLELARTARNFQNKGIVRTYTARLEEILVELQEFDAQRICNCSN